MEIVTLYLQEQKCPIALITLKTLLLIPSPPVRVAGAALPGAGGPEVQHGEQA